jgi:alpha-glucosidase
MLGDGLLIAPVLDEGATTRTVYLPLNVAGWYEFHSGRRHAGGETVTVDAPLGRIPVFARGGAMIALSDKIDGLDPAQDTSRTLLVFAPGCAGNFVGELYDDDGLTTRWREGAGRLVRVSLESDGDGRMRLSATPDGSYRPVYDKIRVQLVGAGSVTLDPESESLLIS